MSTYASAVDVANYIEGWVTDDPFALERLIQRSEEDLDRLLFPYNHNLPPTQVLNLPGAAGGTFTIGWNGPTSAATPPEVFNAAASQLQTDLAAISSIGTGNVIVLGTNPYTVIWTYAWATGFNGFTVPLLTLNVGSTTPPNINASVALVRGRKFNPLVDLNSNQRISLSNATCAQVEYRNAMGEAFFVRAQYSSVKGPDFATSGKMPTIAPKAIRELSQSGLIFTSTRAVSSYRRYGVARGRATY